ncbi:MAG: hypothetical protein EPO31_01775 [Gammaproteobacteria bacterium]|nr:MAG: hypothetical protein EPO31_01775 [Gammaproteobacteria bacterium]
MNLQDAYYEQQFEIEFLRAKGDAFQTFFERLMGFAYKADFMACRPWGNQGDRKNDGFLKSERRLFQVYAPNEMDAAKATKKITEDFAGAREYWSKHFDIWTFVHNATDGLPPHVQKLLLDFEEANSGIRLQPWCLEELRLIFRKLTADDKASWFGPALTDATKINLGFGDLKVVLKRIAGLPAPPMTDVKDVPAGKIEANALSEAVAQLLKEGMVKSPLVADFLNRWHDETLGERLAEAFKTEYQRLRGGHSPNQIFAELQSWAGGKDRGSPEHELAVVTIIAYYFERCDIFEEPRSTAR